MEENKIMSAPSVDRNSNALATLLAEVEKSLALHDYVTGGVDYGYISTGLQAAFDAVKSAAPQQVNAVQAVPELSNAQIYALAEKFAVNQSDPFRWHFTDVVPFAKAIAALASPSPAVPPATFDRADFIRQVVTSVAEIPDRDSPNDQPGMMLVTGGELKNIMENYFEMADEDADVAAPVAGPAAQGAVPEAWRLITTAPEGVKPLVMLFTIEAEAKAAQQAFVGSTLTPLVAQPTDTTAGE